LATPGTPNNFNVQQANQQILVSWGISAGATSYVVQRSLDGVTYTTTATVSGSPLATQYLDTSVSPNTQYFYQVAASNVSGTSPYTAPQSAIPTISGEMSLAELRTRSLQRADRLNTQFVTLTELNSYINQSMLELYDLLITVYEDYYIAPPASFVANGSTYQYPLPDGNTSFLNQQSQPFVPTPLYKLYGVDLAINNAANAYVTVNKYNFVDRNRFVYPNTASTIYGVFNLQYRIMGNNIQFIPTPSANQTIRLWYVPRLAELLLDTDTTTTGISGWTEYIITDVAIKILQKEESPVDVLALQKGELIKRINASAANRDQGMPDKISDTRQGDWSSGWSGGTNGAIGGW
jgi:hypothetical protein